jgi:hypothetical protein
VAFVYDGREVKISVSLNLNRHGRA